ncbi:uncharacterized protein PITG_07182 [Phytophthora infestans T30-4]|uniref:Serine protease family S10 n=1 Tax=Phytophthora infestans (strain T30-4) TaxID=403677 RepID=D0N7G8_PHYIT|nr:uncharacterized protein PITG_07182 [Phytophthora infestans T30-4]EEY53517.1 conserved hypothetical protein [Phytophthora infestans T30-4]|eukprot:XP_002905135.1 conserved hypothetical protein [Phytophthora infestans T30-4]
MATETTPLLQSHRRPQEQYAQHKRRIAGLALLGFVLMIAAVLTTTNIGTKTYPQAVPQHPTACGTDESEAGYITLPYNVDDHLFCWFFESRKVPDTDPFILWVTGSGSGASSLTALLTENGHCRISSDATTTLSAYSWTSEANVV